jgi:ParB family chromosome partitioning protein
MTEQTIYKIPINQITISDANVRHSEPGRDLEELAASIRKHGLLQPVVLMGEYGNPPYQLIVGQRRFLAHRDILHKDMIRATFAGKLNPVQARIRSLVENMHRLDLNHADAAEAITYLYKRLDKDERKVRAETGLSLQRIRQYVDIQERASPKMKEKLRQRKVKPPDVQRALRAASGDVDKAERLLEKVQKYSFTRYQKERLVEYGEAHPKADIDTIIEEAQRPRVERIFSVKLPDRVRAGLAKAADKLAMNPEEVAVQALEEWLSKKGFLSV